MKYAVDNMVGTVTSKADTWTGARLMGVRPSQERKEATAPDRKTSHIYLDV